MKMDSVEFRRHLVSLELKKLKVKEKTGAPIWLFDDARSEADIDAAASEFEDALVEKQSSEEDKAAEAQEERQAQYEEKVMEGFADVPLPPDESVEAYAETSEIRAHYGSKRSD